ncbi:uncharacterized protein HMPREF1541_02149 [Cyphellophora europaea CBS 101466]|uniref:F-box domain-containing protein n=1 Tax=Cyphellophora europaea (strain CBS 101466) TaxID=1220924 RepID=W2S2Q5_CYPE1|nr:uncharacterized protein HMPREF1541_02149 [Cyphellophora europaea CBS 101466]ETN42991.1 hypothetical protein HMPREF1541_02149 [Cyphellophora europaea CBS 101466]
MAASDLTAQPSLPDEMLNMICQELGKDRDFGSLYRCAQASSSVADPALRTMYQYHEVSPSFLQSDEFDPRLAKADFATKFADAEQVFRRWTVLWRSIILSGLDSSRTYKPYCRYLRVLDFRNLMNMLEDVRFQGKMQTAFYAGPMKSVKFTSHYYKGRQIVDGPQTVNAVGEPLTKATTQIEEIAGNIGAGVLPSWISRSPKLESLVLWNGNSLANGAGEAIANHCEAFKSLTIREWRSIPSFDADELFATFLNELRADTLQYFELISFNDIAARSFEALGRHKTLQELKLSNLSQTAIENLHHLKGCTNLHTLALEDNLGTVQLEALNNDVFVEVVHWLSSCSKLRDLALKKFADGPSLLSQVLSSPNVRLTKLSLEGYQVRLPNSQLFHTALSEQKHLESVWLKGNGEDTIPDDLQMMVDGLSNIPHLKELILKDVSDEFQEHHIAQLAINLPELEEFWTSGDVVSGDLLHALVNLRSLKKLDLYAMTQFTSDEIIDFLSKLDPEMQRGFNFSLMAADPNQGNLTDTEQDLIRDYIRSNLDGRFDFVLWREMDTSDSDSD